MPKTAFSFVWQFLKIFPYSWCVWASAFFMTVKTCVKLSYTYVLGQIVEVATTQDIAWSSFEGILFLLGFLSLLAIILFYIDENMWRLFQPRWMAFMKKRLFSYVQSKPYYYFINNHAGRVAQKITEIPHYTMLYVDQILYMILPTAATGLIGVGILIHQNFLIGMIALGWFSVFVVSSIFMGRKCGSLSSSYSFDRGLVSGKVVDSIANNNIVRLFDRKHFEEEYLDVDLKKMMKSGDNLFFYQVGMFFKSAIMIYGFAFFMAGLMIYALIEGTMTLSEMSMQFSVLLLIVSIIDRLPFQIKTMASFAGIVKEGLGLLIEGDDIEFDSAQSVFAQSNLKLEKSDIDIQDLSFQYEGVGALFDGLNLKIAQGEKVGLVGPSGAGKSTLVSLLLRLYDANSGQICIDGQNIYEHQKEVFRDHIAVIPQDTSLFHRSLMDNIRYGRLGASDEEVIEAAKKAYAHEFIETLPQGYETLVGERGVKLSGGQRQRIAIARAILKDAPILILDEATSALDTESEKYIQASLKHLMEDKTVIAIAHRLSTISHLDRLVIMDEGKIVEQGAHGDLLRKEGLYAKLWDMQSGGFLGD